MLDDIETVPAPLLDGSTAGSIGIARQAILDENRSVFGYELLDQTTLAKKKKIAAEAELLFNALCAGDSEGSVSKKPIFLNCTLDSLAGGHLDLVAPERVVLEIPALTEVDVQSIQDRLPILLNLKERGFRLAFHYSVLTRPYESWLALASFIKFDISELNPQAASSFVKLVHAKSKARLIAEKVETSDQYRLLSQLGVKLFQGHWFAVPIVVAGQGVRPAQANILQLLTLVRKQASTEEIEEVLKRDPTLSFNLLRFINSAGFGMRTEVTSFKHAILLLGLNRLFKWAALLMTTSKSTDTPPAVGTTAVVRGRLMELLGTEILTPEECDNAFVVGVFSLLDSMLGVSMEEALSTVSLPESVTQALLHREGPLAPFLELTLACETGDDAAFASSSSMLGLDNNQVNWAHLQALAWAETITEI
jgi:c-di-GMP-related signal transduction protein